MTVLLEYLDFACKTCMINCSFSICNKANPVLEYNFQPVVTSFISKALIMMIIMMTIDASRSY